MLSAKISDNMHPHAVLKNQDNSIVTKHLLVADATTGEIPSRIQIIAAGLWTNSIKGNLEITLNDLVETKLNFDRGVGLPAGGSMGAPVDYSHEDAKKAAGWIKGLEIENGVLYASVEWTPNGAQAIRDKEYAFFSPSIYPACLGTWSDPEDPTVTARNVLMGGGLTNIPFFKGLTGLKASQTLQGADDDNTIYLSADTKGESMTVQEVLAKAPADISDEERKVLADNRTELTADQLIAYGVDKKEETKVEQKIEASTENEEVKTAVALQASITAGTHMVVKADEFNSLKASAEASAKVIADMQREKVATKVEAARAEGKITEDQKEQWVNLLLADASNASLLDGIKANPLLASEIGKDVTTTGKASDEMNKLIAEKLKASTDGGSPLDYGTAASLVRRENPSLAKEYDDEIAS